MGDLDDDDIFSSVNAFCKGNRLNEVFKKSATTAKEKIYDFDANDILESPCVTASAPVPASIKSGSVGGKGNGRTKKKAQEASGGVAATSSTASTASTASVSITDSASASSSNSSCTRSLRSTRARQKRNQAESGVNASNPPNNSMSGSLGFNESGSSIQHTSSTLQNLIETTLNSLPKRTNRRRSNSAKRRGGRSNSRRKNGPNNLGLSTDVFMASLTAAAPPQPLPSNAYNNRRARRNFVAEIAARSQVVDYVDLISSPVILPPITGVINVDSDEELANTSTAITNSCVNNSIDSIDELEQIPINVKVKWEDKIEIFPCRKYQKFVNIINDFAKRENVNKENICLNLGDRIISENDTPDSINYEVHMFIHGRKVERAITSVANNKSNKDSSLIDLKLQREGQKRRIVISLKKTDKFYVLYAKCSEEFNVPASKLKLFFDGELLEMNDTPEDLDFEGDEIIDCKIKS